jgi:L-ascorbate metabolism protein UlaG (beta-lactamase superfamily)
MSTVRYFATLNVPFFVPLGVGAHLEEWGVPASRIVELDWSQSQALGPLELVCTPARHFSGRSLLDRNQTLWSSWTFLGPAHRVFYSGDTGPSGEFENIGRRFGPFDLAIIQIGAYGEDWPYIHLAPEEVIEVHLAVGGKRLLPVHWGTFDLALHDWDEPIEGAVVAAREASIDLLTPQLGEIVDMDQPPKSHPWWQ